MHALAFTSFRSHNFCRKSPLFTVVCVCVFAGEVACSQMLVEVVSVRQNHMGLHSFYRVQLM